MMKRAVGPSSASSSGVHRTPDKVTEIATKWSKVLRTGAKEVKFWGVDISTIMFNMEAGQDVIELKEFILGQSEAYEFKIGDQVFRQHGDTPLEVVLEKLNNEKNKEIDSNPTEDNNNLKEEL